MMLRLAYFGPDQDPVVMDIGSVLDLEDAIGGKHALDQAVSPSCRYAVVIGQRGAVAGLDRGRVDVDEQVAADGVGGIGDFGSARGFAGRANTAKSTRALAIYGHKLGRETRRVNYPESQAVVTVRQLIVNSHAQPSAICAGCQGVISVSRHLSARPPATIRLFRVSARSGARADHEPASEA